MRKTGWVTVLLTVSLAITLAGCGSTAAKKTTDSTRVNTTSTKKHKAKKPSVKKIGKQSSASTPVKQVSQADQDKAAIAKLTLADKLALLMLTATTRQDLPTAAEVIAGKMQFESNTGTRSTKTFKHVALTEFTEALPGDFSSGAWVKRLSPSTEDMEIVAYIKGDVVAVHSTQNGMDEKSMLATPGAGASDAMKGSISALYARFRNDPRIKQIAAKIVTTDAANLTTVVGAQDAAAATASSSANTTPASAAGKVDVHNLTTQQVKDWIMIYIRKTGIYKIYGGDSDQAYDWSMNPDSNGVLQITVNEDTDYMNAHYDDNAPAATGAVVGNFSITSEGYLTVSGGLVGGELVSEQGGTESYALLSKVYGQ